MIFIDKTYSGGHSDVHQKSTAASMTETVSTGTALLNKLFHSKTEDVEVERWWGIQEGSLGTIWELTSLTGGSRSPCHRGEGCLNNYRCQQEVIGSIMKLENVLVLHYYQVYLSEKSKRLKKLRLYCVLILSGWLESKVGTNMVMWGSRVWINSVIFKKK